MVSSSLKSSYRPDHPAGGGDHPDDGDGGGGEHAGHHRHRHRAQPKHCTELVHRVPGIR